MYNNLRLIYITTPTKEEARTIGRVLVEKRMAACVNIVEGMESIYRWEGKIEEARECILIAKTHYSKVKALTDQVLKLHSYECPSIISVTITEDEGHEDYLKWIIKETKEGA